MTFTNCDDGEIAEVDVPSTWTPMKSGERFARVELDANSEEYKRIEQSVRATCQNTVNQIVKVFSSVAAVHSACDILPFVTARRNARIASAVLATAIPSVCPSVRLSVCLSVTRWYCVKTTARSTVQFAPSDSKMCLVL